MSSPVIEVSGLSKSFYKHIPRLHETLFFGKKPLSFQALKDISFTVNAGEIVGIVGNNGCGKSTLLKILARTMIPSAGYATIRGTVRGLLETGLQLYPNLSGWDNLNIGLKLLGVYNARTLHQAAEYSELEDFLAMPVKRYSSGMVAKLTFSLAIQSLAEVMIIDEVLAVGDHIFQKKCLKTMQDIVKHTGRTVLFVLHSKPTVRALCHRCLVLHQGSIICDTFDVDKALDLY